jgi:hypothetical protein
MGRIITWLAKARIKALFGSMKVFNFFGNHGRIKFRDANMPGHFFQVHSIFRNLGIPVELGAAQSAGLRDLTWCEKIFLINSCGILGFVKKFILITVFNVLALMKQYSF